MVKLILWLNIMDNFSLMIGPIIGFFLGIITILFKQFLDKRQLTRKILNSLNQLKELIKNSPPPTTFFPKKSDSGFMHADEANNLANISRYYMKLMPIKSIIRTIENGLNNSNNINLLLDFIPSNGG